MNKDKIKTIRHTIDIDASRESIWSALTGDANFRDWCAFFMPGSYYEGEWKAGNEVRFLGKSDSGKVSGMITKLEVCKPGFEILARHQGEIMEDIENRDDSEWIGLTEGYRIEGNNSPYRLAIENDVPESFFEMFDEIWPKSLKRIKELAEG